MGKHSTEVARVAEVPPIAVSVADAAKALAISTWQCYQLLDQGVIESRYQGRRRLVSYQSMCDYFEALPTVPEKAS